MLAVRDLSMSFAGLRALSGVSFEVREGEVRAVIGPNGAGKTTLFNLITGALVPQAGELSFAGVSLLGRGAPAIARLGLARTFQQAQLYRSLSVIENVLLGCHAAGRSGLVESPKCGRTNASHSACQPCTSCRHAAKRDASTSRRCGSRLSSWRTNTFASAITPRVGG